MLQCAARLQRQQSCSLEKKEQSCWLAQQPRLLPLHPAAAAACETQHSAAWLCLCIRSSLSLSPSPGRVSPMPRRWCCETQKEMQLTRLWRRSRRWVWGAIQGPGQQAPPDAQNASTRTHLSPRLFLQTHPHQVHAHPLFGLESGRGDEHMHTACRPRSFWQRQEYGEAPCQARQPSCAASSYTRRQGSRTATIARRLTTSTAHP